jgi:hypothetical protein
MEHVKTLQKFSRAITPSNNTDECRIPAWHMHNPYRTVEPNANKAACMVVTAQSSSLSICEVYFAAVQIHLLHVLVLEEVSTGHLVLSHSVLPYWTIPDTRSINWTQTHFHWYLINLLHTTEIWPVMSSDMWSILDSFAMAKTKTLWVTNGYDHLDSLCLFWYSKEWQYLFDYLHIFRSFPLQSSW